MGDPLKGPYGHDTLNGGRDHDQLYGLSGDDKLNGGSGNDWLFGGSGTGQLLGGTGNDRLQGGLGNDILNGGADSDTADYSTLTIDPPGPIGPILNTGATGGVTVDLVGRDGQATGGGGSDTLFSIENVTGSRFDDTIGVDGAENSTLNGGNGNDSIFTARFDGTVNGGAGTDFINLNFEDEVTCVYNEVRDSPTGVGRDVITGFDGESGDQIDLSNINVTGLSYADEILKINTDSDAAAEMQIQLIGEPSVFPYIIT